MAQSPYPIDPDLTAIAVAYENKMHIADKVAPRIRVGKQEFKYLKYDDFLNFDIPDTLVGRKGMVNTVEMGGSEVTDSTKDHGLQDGVPQSDIDNKDQRYDPVTDMGMFLRSQIALAREKRVADLVFNQASYLAGLKATLAPGNQFSEVAVNPIPVIAAAMDLPLSPVNKMVFGRPAWTKFRANPFIVKACLGNAGDAGLVTRQQVADLFEVDEVIVGESRGNAARKGQAGVQYRLWGKHIALIHQPEISTRETAGFTSTFQWGDFVGMQWPDRNIGLEGGQMIRIGERVKERVVAAQSGYFFENAVL
jgi:hypothetical protein